MEDLKHDLKQMEGDLRDRLRKAGREDTLEEIQEVEEEKKEHENEATRIRAWLGEESSSDSSSDEENPQVRRPTDRDPDVKERAKYDYSSGLSTDDDIDLLIE